MRLLLDTHALAWWTDGSDQLSRAVREVIEDESAIVFVSAVSVYEMAYKHRAGKWEQAAILLGFLDQLMSDQFFLPLPLSIDHARRAGELGQAHRDPFDRMLIAQAIVEDLTLASNEKCFDQFDVRRLW